MEDLFMGTKVENPASYPCGLMELLPVGENSYGPISIPTKKKLEEKKQVSFETLELWYPVWTDFQEEPMERWEMTTYQILDDGISAMDVLEMISQLYNEVIPLEKVIKEKHHFRKVRNLGRSIKWRHTLPEYTDIKGLQMIKDNCGAMVVLKPRPGVN